MRKHAIIKTYGLVQGVTFRFSARIVAEKMGIVGYAKNQDDGSVLIEAEGEEANLEKFIVWCHRGPEDAKVDNVEVAYSDKLENFKTFESIRSKNTADA